MVKTSASPKRPFFFLDFVSCIFFKINYEFYYENDCVMLIL